MWSGVGAGTEGYTSAPGYGNNWNDYLDFRWTVMVDSRFDSVLTKLAVVMKKNSSPACEPSLL